MFHAISLRESPFFTSFRNTVSVLQAVPPAQAVLWNRLTSCGPWKFHSPRSTAPPDSVSADIIRRKKWTGSLTFSRKSSRAFERPLLSAEKIAIKFHFLQELTFLKEVFSLNPNMTLGKFHRASYVYLFHYASLIWLELHSPNITFITTRFFHVQKQIFAVACFRHGIDFSWNRLFSLRPNSSKSLYRDFSAGRSDLFSFRMFLDANSKTSALDRYWLASADCRRDFMETISPAVCHPNLNHSRLP